MTNLSTDSHGTTAVPTEELDGLRLCLRDDLEFTLQQYGGEVCYVIEDPVHAAYFRIGLPEYTFLSLLNGKNTVGEAIARCAVSQGADAINEQEASLICRWLTSNQLASTTDTDFCSQPSELQEQMQRDGWKRWLNPMSITLKFGNPEPLLQTLMPLGGWIHRSYGIVLWCLLLFVGMIRLIVDHHSLIHDSVPAISPVNWLWLGLTWFGLKCLHEMSHGLCCLVHGGRVRMWGMNFLMFAPLPFVDATSAWRMQSKWSRIQVAFAGIYAELAVAALAIIVRSSTDDAVIRMICLNVMLTGGLMTLLFNLNPLSRFDGYYILADWLEIPNLSQQASILTIGWIKRILFAVPFRSEHSLRRTALLISYGTLSSVWRFLMIITMIITAEKLFHGAGVALAILGTILWLILPLWKVVRYIVLGNLQDRPSRQRFALITGVTLLLCVFGSRWLVWSESLKLAAIVDYFPSETVRCRVDGFVSDVLVEPGQAVVAGQVLLTLSNPKIDFEVAELTLELNRSQVRQRFYQSNGDIAARQTEDATALSLETKLEEKRRMQADLVVRSPHDGVVIAADLNNLTGQFLVRGQSICTVGNAEQLTLRVVIPQDEQESVKQQVGQLLRVRFDGESHGNAMGRLVDLESRASSELIHPALASTAGGPLSVQMGPVERDSSTGQQWILTEPCFTGSISIPESYVHRCGAGQLATITLTKNQSSIVLIGKSKIKDWLSN